MIIRRQDKRRIVNFNNLVSISVCMEVVYAEIDNGKGFFEIGKYKSEERAMEVIDRLYKGGPDETYFIMPKE